MVKKSVVLCLLAVCSWAQINVGPAIQNLNSRVLFLENKTLTVEEVAALGFLTNETDYVAMSAIGALSGLETENKGTLVAALNEVNGKATYPLRVYGAQTNSYLEIDGFSVKVWTNGILAAEAATKEEVEELAGMFYSLPPDTMWRDRAFQKRWFEADTSAGIVYQMEEAGGSTNLLKTYVLPTNSVPPDILSVSAFEAWLTGYGKPVSGSLFMSAYSNQTYSFSTGAEGVAIPPPEGRPGKDNLISLHVFKDDGEVVWPEILWVYGEPPDFQPGKTNVVRLESLDGISWRGWFEYYY